MVDSTLSVKTSLSPFRVLSHNVLFFDNTDGYSYTTVSKYCKKQFLDPEYRNNRIFEGLSKCNPDIILFQEFGYPEKLAPYDRLKGKLRGFECHFKKVNGFPMHGRLISFRCSRFERVDDAQDQRQVDQSMFLVLRDKKLSQLQKRDCLVVVGNVHLSADSATKTNGAAREKEASEAAHNLLSVRDDLFKKHLRAAKREREKIMVSNEDSLQKWRADCLSATEKHEKDAEATFKINRMEIRAKFLRNVVAHRFDEDLLHVPKEISDALLAAFPTMLATPFQAMVGFEGCVAVERKAACTVELSSTAVDDPSFLYVCIPALKASCEGIMYKWDQRLKKLKKKPGFNPDAVVKFEGMTPSLSAIIVANTEEDAVRIEETLNALIPVMNKDLSNRPLLSVRRVADDHAPALDTIPTILVASIYWLYKFASEFKQNPMNSPLTAFSLVAVCCDDEDMPDHNWEDFGFLECFKDRDFGKVFRRVVSGQKADAIVHKVCEWALSANSVWPGTHDAERRRNVVDSYAKKVSEEWERHRASLPPVSHPPKPTDTPLPSAPEPVVRILLGGDFNTLPGDLRLTRDNATPCQFIDAYASAGGERRDTYFVGTDDGCHGTIDYLLTPATAEKGGLRVINTLKLPSREELSMETALPNSVYGSDHLAIVADFDF